MEDFFFGRIGTNKNGMNQLDLYQVIDHGKMVSPEYFTGQLNRILSKWTIIDIYNESSYPDFHKFISLLSWQDIGMIIIGQRKDVNNSVDATLDCSIFLENGIARVTAHWCAYKEIRASEIISTLWKPIVDNKFIEKTYIKQPNGEIEKLSSDKQEASRQLFTLSGYPEAANL